MATLISMKRPAKKKKTLRSIPAPEEEKFPYGLRLTLDKEELKKLGVNLKDYDLKDKIRFVCDAKITSMRTSDDISYDDNRESMDLQITEMGIEPKQIKLK